MDIWCGLSGFLLTGLHPMAIWTIAGINYDRYTAITAPLEYVTRVSCHRVKRWLAGLWTMTILLCTLPFWRIVPFYRYRPGIRSCIPDFGNSSWGITATSFGFAYVAMGIIVPVMCITVWSLHVLTIALQHRHRIAGTINNFEVQSKAAVGRSRSAIATVIQLVSPLYVLYMPYCCLIIWEISGVHSRPQLLDHPELASAASLLLGLSPLANGLLYATKSQSLRRAVQSYWRKKMSRLEFRREIHARETSAAELGSGTGSSTSNVPLLRTISENMLIASPARTELQPAGSCNTVAIPMFELGKSGETSRSSTSGEILETKATIETVHI